MFDSGIRTGSDIIKAIALGAQGVLSTFSESFLLVSSLISDYQLLDRSCMVWPVGDKRALSRSFGKPLLTSRSLLGSPDSRICRTCGANVKK